MEFQFLNVQTPLRLHPTFILSVQRDSCINGFFHRSVQSYFATVLTNKFTAEVWNPDGTITALNLGPGIGPSGKMNFASGGGG